MTPPRTYPGHAVLLLRLHRYTGTVSSFLYWTPEPGAAGEADQGSRHQVENRKRITSCRSRSAGWTAAR